MTVQSKLGVDLSLLNFGLGDAFELLETQKDFNIIVFGVGLQYQDVLTTILMNEKTGCIVISPVFETENQQALTIFCPKDVASLIEDSLKKIELFGNEVKRVDINEDYAAIRLLPCYFSPLVSQKEDHLANSGINLEALGIKSGQNQARKDKKFKHMTLDELDGELKSRENKFKIYFIEEKKKKADFSLKDIKDENIHALLKEINEIKRIQKVLQSKHSSESTIKT